MAAQPTRSLKNRSAATVRASILAPGIIYRLVSIYISLKMFLSLNEKKSVKYFHKTWLTNEKLVKARSARDGQGDSLKHQFIGIEEE